MNTKDLIRLGVPVGEPILLAHEFIRNFLAHGNEAVQLEAEILEIVANPPAFLLIESETRFGLGCEFKQRRVHDVIVHRKGATPAGAGVPGVIPGSMASPGYVVRGKGSPESLHSASHGAGRVMSRTKAMQSFTWSATRKLLAERGVELLSAGLDEVPGVYKDIHVVMAAQTDLVEVLGQFDPKLVKMCPAGERAED
jgi:RNA-splicing ligase RtcB